MPEKFELTERDIDRLRSKIRPDDSGCWLWSGGHFAAGYAIFTVKMKDGVWRPTTAHRAAYIAFIGPIPEGLEIDHLCRNRACVNPAHLEPVTHRENGLRGTSPAALAAKRTHCPLGHEYNEENTYNKPGTRHRECRECMRIRDRKRQISRRGYVPPSRRPITSIAISGYMATQIGAGRTLKAIISEP